MSTATFEERRLALLREMLPHTCIGHPLAAVLSLVGLRKLADAIHYHTLPRRARRRLKPSDISFTHDKRLFWADFLWGVPASILRAIGKYNTAAKVFSLGPQQAVLELGACNYSRPLKPGQRPAVDLAATLLKTPGLLDEACKQCGLKLSDTDPNSLPRWVKIGPRFREGYYTSREDEWVRRVRDLAQQIDLLDLWIEEGRPSRIDALQSFLESKGTILKARRNQDD